METTTAAEIVMSTKPSININKHMSIFITFFIILSLFSIVFYPTYKKNKAKK